MRGREEETLRPGAAWFEHLGGYFGQRVAALRAWLRPEDVPEQFEGAVQVALRPVEPSASFREGLRGNLTVAARSRMSGLVIEYPRPLREGIILGLSAGLFATLLTTIILIFRSRASH